MLEIKGKKVPGSIANYYLFTAFYAVLIFAIKSAGWNRVTSFLFFAATIVSLIWMEYILHMFFKGTNKSRKSIFDYGADAAGRDSGRKGNEAGNCGQIWVVLIHLSVMVWFIFS